MFYLSMRIGPGKFLLSTEILLCEGGESGEALAQVDREAVAALGLPGSVQGWVGQGLE